MATLMRKLFVPVPSHPMERNRRLTERGLGAVILFFIGAGYSVFLNLQRLFTEASLELLGAVTLFFLMPLTGGFIIWLLSVLYLMARLSGRQVAGLWGDWAESSTIWFFLVPVSAAINLLVDPMGGAVVLLTGAIYHMILFILAERPLVRLVYSLLSGFGSLALLLIPIALAFWGVISAPEVEELFQGLGGGGASIPGFN